MIITNYESAIERIVMDGWKEQKEIVWVRILNRRFRRRWVKVPEMYYRNNPRLEIVSILLMKHVYQQ